MKNIFALASIPILLLQVFPVAAAEELLITTPSFIQCSLKNSLPAATKHTIGSTSQVPPYQTQRLADGQIIDHSIDVTI